MNSTEEVMEPSGKDEQNEENPQLAWSQEIPDYGNKLLKRLDEFRKTTILYDVCVRAQGGEFNAHKVILAACGGIFRTCFIDEKKKMISNDCTELNLDCPVQGLKPIIRFAYTGGLVVTKRNAVATMIAAEATKMREVQEICAGIALKEYGWLVHFTGEKDESVIENLGKVLNLHESCLVKGSINGNHAAEEDELPFEVEVNEKFPGQTAIYHWLAIKLKSAEDFALNVKQNGDRTVNPAEKNVKVKENGRTGKPKSASVSSDSSGHDSADGKKSDASSCSENHPTTNSSVVTEKNEAASDEHDLGVPATPDNAPEKKFPPQSPLIKPRTEKIGVAPDEHDHNVSATPEKTPKKELPSQSPQVKPRTSIKVKKIAPLPPSPGAAEKAEAGKPLVEKYPRPPAPRRPTKQPPKVPPPRPKPPIKKKTLSEQDATTPKKEVNDDDYDDSLNPFA